MERKTYSKRFQGDSSEKYQRLFSTVVITEKGLPTKTVVPSHWVSLDKYIVYFPPKGYKTLGTYISEWALPEPGWKKYKFIEFILEAGTLETCNQMLQFQTEDESERKSKEVRAPSPELNIIFNCNEPVNSGFSHKLSDRYSNTEKLKAAQAPSLLPDFTPDFINKNVEKSKEVRAPSPELDFIFHSNESMSSGFTHRLSNKCSNTGDLKRKHSNIGDGGVSFKEMPNKQFQYAIFMELTSQLDQVKENQKKILDRLELLESNDAGPSGFATADILTEPIDTMERFDEEENGLNSSKAARFRKITQIKGVGGSTPRRLVKNVLDSIMTQPLQSCFSKDGIKGKRKFVATTLYKCLKKALISEKDGFDVGNIETRVGDL
ncbi:uncharacterized protein LOC136090497 isoform X2 [Hydra vulgaris]|uniref:Uncharacterized protein LOC136090497 isoform X2 n=1 Tax=Hydra vulgaris TaxID=6087 RepID=A0ABM4DFR6_HYDVU